MKASGRESRRVRQRVDQALDVLRVTLADYLPALPRSRPDAFRDFDLQRLLVTFIDRFDELRLELGVRTLAFAAKDARNELAHYTGTLTADEALHHLSTVRRLLEALGSKEGLSEVDGLYQEQLRALVPSNAAAQKETSGRARNHQFGSAEGVSGAEPASARSESTSLDSAPSRPEARSAPSFRTAVDGSGPRSVRQLAPRASVQPPRGRYAPLFEHLASQDGDVWHTTFGEIETLLGLPLPHSARSHRPWWANGGHSQAKAWLAAGWKTGNVDIGAERLSFVRSQAGGRNVVTARSSTAMHGASSTQAEGMSEADRVRAFASEHFVDAARLAGEEMVVIRAGDVARQMNLSHHMANVCSSLGGRKFEALANVTLVDRAGPSAGSNTEFVYAIQTVPSHRQSLRVSRPADVPAEPLRVPGGNPSRSREVAPVLPPRTALVFPCASAKAAHAGRFRMSDGSAVFFVADPALAPPDATVRRHPDDDVTRGYTFRQALDDYNLHSRDENPWKLLPAWQLYDKPAYRALADAVGIANLFILSAGWGLIGADYLTPDYDVTFSNASNVEAFKRRTGRDRWNDFNHLTDADFDRVVFAGGKGYETKFLELTQGLDLERQVFHNSAGSRRTDAARFIRFETDRRTNWHYEWAESFVAGKVRVW